MKTLFYTHHGLALRGISNLNNSSSKTIIAIHGWCDNAASFLPWINFSNEYNFIAIDLAGHGYSEHRHPQARYDFIAYVEDILSVIDSLEDREIYLFGHSLGGAISSIVACLTQKVKGLVLFEGLGPLTKESNQTKDQWLKSIKDSGSLKLKRRRTFDSKKVALELRKQGLTLDPVHLEPIIERALIPFNDEFKWRHDPRILLKSPILFHEDNVKSLMEFQKLRTLFLYGADSSFPSPNESATLTKRIEYFSNIKVARVNGGHYLHLDAYEEVKEIVFDWLKQGNIK